MLADLQLESPRRSAAAASSAAQFDGSNFHSASVPWDAWTNTELHSVASMPGSHTTTGASSAFDNLFVDYHHRQHFHSPMDGQAISGLSTLQESVMGESSHSAFEAEEGVSNLSMSTSGKRPRTRLQRRTSKSQPSPSQQPYPTSSPARSRSSSIRAGHPPDSFFIGSFPAVHPAPDGTIDPAMSVRSTSPSASSVSSAHLSQVGSSSASPSVHSNEGISASVPRRSHKKAGSVASTSRSGGSPKKSQGVRKLTDADRRNICRFHNAHEGVKQETIAAKFNIERSTVSKILKNSDRWLSLPSDGDEDFDLPSRMSAPARSSPPLTPVKRIMGGRYPDLETAIVAWARSLTEAGHVLDDDTLHSQALIIASSLKGCESFKASATWLEGFKIRAGIEAGTFVDLLSPNTVSRIRREKEAGIEEEGEESEEGIDEDEVNEDDGDFEDSSSAARSRKSRSRRAAPHAAGAPPHRSLTAFVEAKPDQDSAPQVSPTASQFSLSRMDVDSRTPLRATFPDLSAEATPTHSRRGTYRDPPPSGSSTPADLFYAPPSSFGYTSLSTSSSAELPYPLQSPYLSQSQSQNSPLPFTPFQSSSIDSSGYSNSPTLHQPASLSLSSNAHGRTGSTASSSSSSLAFANPTPSLYSSYSSQSNPGSTPSTPATGYFGHGPDGTQSQLQAAFLTQQHSAPIPAQAIFQSAPSPTGRRATISGGQPSGAFNTQPLRQQPLQLSPAPSAVTLDQALHSLQQALEYLSHDGQGIVTPGDLVALADVKGKLAQAATGHPASSRPSTAASPVPSQFGFPPQSVLSTQSLQSSAASNLKSRMKLSRAGSHHGHSASFSGSSSMGRRSQSSTNLVSVYDNEAL